MSFTAVSAGELIKASIANANWRHVGRLGADLLPFTVAGAGVDDTWDIGSDTYQWKDIYFSGKLYQNGSEFVAGGGGGGGGLESLALANAFDKQGMSYPLPNALNIRNSFVDDNEIMLYLRKSYSTADTTIMIADHGTANELETLDDMEATTGWNASLGTPALSQDSTNVLEGTYSVKAAYTTLNGTGRMNKNFSLNMTDKSARVSVFPSTLSNVVNVFVEFETSGGNSASFAFSASDLTASAWNHLTCDFSDASNYTESGTFNRALITNVYMGVNTSSAQSIDLSWDLFRTISDKPLLIPNYGLSFTIQDNTNQDSFTITDEDLTNNTTKGTFTIDATLGNNYTNIDSTNYASSTTGTIENNQFIHKSTASGQNAKTAKQHEILALQTTQATGTLESFLRFYDDVFEVDEFPTTGTINLKEISAAATEKGRFLDDDYIILFKKLRAGIKNQSMEGSYTTNYLRLQLNANAGDSSDLITLSHDGSNSVGADTTGYYVVPESAYLEYSAGAKTASTFTLATPAEFLINEDFISYPSSVYSHWKMDELTGNEPDVISGNNLVENGTVGSTMGAINRARNSFSTSDYFTLSSGGSSATQYDNNLFMLEFYMQTSSTGVEQNLWSKGTFLANGKAVGITTGNVLTFVMGGLANISSSATVTDGNIHHILIAQRAASGSNEARIYVDGVNTGQRTGGTHTPTNSDIYVGIKNTLAANTQMKGWIDDIIYHNTCLSWSEVEELVARRTKKIPYGASGGGYTLKYKVEDLTDIDKVETITTLKRQDTSNQNPVIYETGSLLY